MYTYEAKKFTIPALDGVSDESVKQHIGLYEGYVKNFNAISAKLVEYAKEGIEKNTLAISELVRRKSFEFDGMRLHELYFAQLEGGAAPLTASSALGRALTTEYHGYVVEYMKAVGGIRGPGWAMLYFDPVAKQFQSGFAGEQHQGHFATLPIVLALDVWEHAYLLDYGAAGRGAYIDAFFKNLNWGVIERRFDALT